MAEDTDDDVLLQIDSAGNTAKMATDFLAGKHHPYAKLEVGADGTATPVSDTNPLPSKLPPSSNIAVVPTVSTTPAYTSGDVVGGVVSIANAARVAGGSGIIQSVTVNKKVAQTAPYDILIFNANPSNGTYTDNGALALNTTDQLAHIGTIHCNDVVSLGTPQCAQSTNGGLNFKLASGTTLYAIPVIRGGDTYSSTSDVQLIFNIIPD